MVTVHIYGLNTEQALRWVAAHLDPNAKADGAAVFNLRPTDVRVSVSAEAHAVSYAPNAVIFKIKRIREETHCGLAEAKRAIEACDSNADAAIRLVKAVGVDQTGRLLRPWSINDVKRALSGKR